MTERRRIRLEVNGRTVHADVSMNQSLTEVLRTDAGATDVKYGCGEGVCGTCCVLLDGEPVNSCLVFAVQADGASITTLPGSSPTTAACIRCRRPSSRTARHSAGSARRAWC